MRSAPSESERPSSATGEERRPKRASTSPGMRGQLPTLIGVAPAAPIVSGRPSASGMKTHDDEIDTLETATLSPGEDARAREEPPTSGMRPLSDPSLTTSENATSAMMKGDGLGLPPMRAPKHTFDAISIGQMPAASRRRGRTTVAVVGVVAAIAVVGVGVGRHVVSKGDPSAIAHAAAAPAMETTPAPAPLAASDPPTSALAGEPSATTHRPSVAPSKNKHGKPTPHHKHAPARTTN
jgi:hypothetical protein